MTDHDHAGAGRRLTAEEEGRGAEMFAGGASTRAVAAELGCGAGTASRLRQRLEARGALAPAAGADDDGEQADDYSQDGELAALLARREALAGALSDHLGRAQASAEAVRVLEAERLQVLAEHRDAAPLRDRLRNAQDDARDSADAAELTRRQIADVDAQIAVIEQRRSLAGLRGDLAAAVAERDAVCARTGELQRAAVLAVRVAAEQFTGALAADRAVVTRAEELAAAVTAMALEVGEQPPVVSPAASSALWVAPDTAVAGGPLALWRAISEARQGNQAAVAELLGICNGWLPPSEAERAEADAEWRKRAEAITASQPAAQPPAPWPHADPASVGIDAQGRPLPWRPAPHPLDFYNAPANWGDVR